MKKENFVLTDYEIKGILGKGTFSKVKLGINKITKEKVAIKIIDKKCTINQNNYDRIKREISILKNSYHINIIKVLDIKEDSNNFYFIMEFCHYGELFLHIVNNKHLDDKQASFYFFQLINGLNYLHTNNIVHRDLKPENLLLTKNKILKIIDFGLSNFSPENQYLNTPCGSPSYASPEMIKGKQYNGFLADIWSCGIILYVMLCGYLPFDGFTNNDLFKKILKCKVNYPNNIDNSAIDLMKNILVANPEKRIDLNKIKQHPFYLKGKNIFYQKFPYLINEVKQTNLIYINKTLKKSISDSINNNFKSNKDINNNNNDNGKKYKNERNNGLSNSVNKNNNKKEKKFIDTNNCIKNNENNLYNNLLCHTKNINYYKKILSDRLSIHNIRKNKNKMEENNNNEINTNNNIHEKKNLSNSKIKKKNYSLSKNYENYSSNKRNKNKINLSNSLNSKGPKKKNLKISIKNNPYKKDTKNITNLAKTMEKYEDNKEISEDKKRLTTVSFNENILNSKYGSQSPNFILLKKLLKNAQNNYAEEKDINKVKESIVYNAQRETQIFNINHTINKIKKLKRIYENEINNGNEYKKKEYFSTNNSNSNIQMNIKKSSTKLVNDISQNNYVYKKQKISPIKKNDPIFNSLNSNVKKNSQKGLNYYNSISNINKINNNELIIYDNIYYNNENNKENSINKKNINNNYKIKTNDSLENIEYIFIQNNSNNPNSCYQSSAKVKNNKQNKIIKSERIDIKNATTNFNSVNKSPLDNKNKINFSLSKNDSNSIKVNKNIRNKKNNVKQNNDNQCSLTNKLNAIKKNFNIGNKDIFILDNKKEDIMNYITNHNKKINSTRSQKFINNRGLGETLNISTKNDLNKKRNKYSAKLESNSSNYSEKKIKKINSNYSSKEIRKSEKKNNVGSFIHRFNFMNKNRDILYNDENQNYNNNKMQIKNRYTIGPEKKYKYSEDFTLYKEYFNFNNNNIIDNNKKELIKKKANRSVSMKKDKYKN